MKRLPVLLLLIFTILTVPAWSNPGKKNKKVLLFYKTAGFYHGSIKPGIPAIMQLGAENKFIVDTTRDASQITPEVLREYKAVIFLNTTGDILNADQQTALEQFIRSGGGFVGIHAATDCEYGWKWYGNLVGAYFGGHPAVQEATLTVKDRRHPSTTSMATTFSHKDEWYNFKWIADDIKVLVSIDEKSYKGGTNGDNHPISWYHAYDGGRSFYTAMGHTNENFSDPVFMKHLLGGIKYAIGKR
jgi:type 1 glutamine amidotransferase